MTIDTSTKATNDSSQIFTLLTSIHVLYLPAHVTKDTNKSAKSDSSSKSPASQEKGFSGLWQLVTGTVAGRPEVRDVGVGGDAPASVDPEEVCLSICPSVCQSVCGVDCVCVS